MIIRSLFSLALLLAVVVSNGWSAPYRVLVVMSYEESFPWVQEIREGLENALGTQAEIHYFYMDTKNNLKGGPQKAKEALKLYQALQPDGVITADDNAQSLFVVPYLKNKVSTPVVFCGVNAEPEAYGYPATNVTGILERFHLVETLAFSQQLKPDIETFGFIIKESPVAELLKKQLYRDAGKFPARFVRFAQPTTRVEAITMATELRASCDLLIVETLRGVTDPKGQPLDDTDVIPQVVAAFGKPTAGTNSYTIELGVLSAVVKTGQEQGRTAGEMLLKAMQGIPVHQIPITRNYQGKRIINVETMQNLKLKPSAIILRGSTLVRTTPREN